MKSSKSHWFHCSSVFHGEQWVAKRIVPKYIGADEPKVPRLCVASNVVRCFAARVFIGDVFVYRTAAPRRSVKPYGVNDRVITREYWLIPPVPMVLDHIIPSRMVREICGERTDKLRDIILRNKGVPISEIKEHLTALDRVKGLKRAAEVLGDDGGVGCKTDLRFANMAIDSLEKMERERFLVA